MDKSKIIINHPQGVTNLEILQKDVNAAKRKGYGHCDFAFTYLTVQSLIDKIEEQAKMIQDVKDTMNEFFNTVTFTQFEERANDTIIEDGY